MCRIIWVHPAGNRIFVIENSLVTYGEKDWPSMSSWLVPGTADPEV